MGARDEENSKESYTVYELPVVPGSKNLKQGWGPLQALHGRARKALRVLQESVVQKLEEEYGRMEDKLEADMANIQQLNVWR